jgi:type I site-specific restriction endonuclease
VNQIIEFKQIVGRGTRLFDGKEFFTIYDFVDAYQRFSDPEWDGEPVEEGKVFAKWLKRSEWFFHCLEILAKTVRLFRHHWQ